MLLINRIRSEEVEYLLKLGILLVVFVLLAFNSVLISALTNLLESETGADT